MVTKMRSSRFLAGLYNAGSKLSLVLVRLAPQSVIDIRYHRYGSEPYAQTFGMAGMPLNFVCVSSCGLGATSLMLKVLACLGCL